MQAFKKVDMESWPRREHYRYYTEALKVEFNMTAPVDVQNLLRFCHAHGYKFYAAAIYCVTKALGRIENFRMFKNADGELCVWDKIVPNFTFFHPDDCTFSDCWTDFSEDFPTFYNAITADMQTYKDVKGIKTKPNQPANFYCVSCTPWTAFTGCGSRVADGQPAYFPIVVMGRYEKCGGKVNMPVNITIAHAVADGYHAGLFFRYLQEELDSTKDAHDAAISAMWSARNEVDGLKQERRKLNEALITERETAEHWKEEFLKEQAYRLSAEGRIMREFNNLLRYDGTAHGQEDLSDE